LGSSGSTWGRDEESAQAKKFWMSSEQAREISPGCPGCPGKKRIYRK